MKDNWISVKDRLPIEEDYKDLDVLIYICKYGEIFKHGYQMIAFYNGKTWESETGVGDNLEDNPDYMVVTHWQPLPDDPIK